MTDTERIQSLEYELETTRAQPRWLRATIGYAGDTSRLPLTDLRLTALETSRADHEQRLRNVEEVARARRLPAAFAHVGDMSHRRTKFNFLMALSIGGGALSAIVLIRTALGT